MLEKGPTWMNTMISWLIICITFLAATPVLCNGDDWQDKLALEDAKLQFKRYERDVNDRYRNFVSGWENIFEDSEWEKRNRMLDNYDSKEWVAQNILRLVKKDMIEHTKFLFSTLTTRTLEHIEVEMTRWERGDNTEWSLTHTDQIIQMVRKIGTAKAVEGYEKRLVNMKQKASDMQNIARAFVRSEAFLEKWASQYKQLLPDKEDYIGLSFRGLPFDPKDYFLEIALKSPRPNFYWMEWLDRTALWERQHRSQASRLYRLNYPTYIGITTSAGAPAFFEYIIKTALLNTFQEAVVAGFRADGLLGAVKWDLVDDDSTNPPDKKYCLSLAPEIGDKKYKSRMETALRGEGQDHGFGINELLLKGLQLGKASQINKVAKIKSMDRYRGSRPLSELDHKE